MDEDVGQPKCDSDPGLEGIGYNTQNPKPQYLNTTPSFDVMRLVNIGLPAMEGESWLCHCPCL